MAGKKDKSKAPLGAGGWGVSHAVVIALISFALNMYLG